MKPLFIILSILLLFTSPLFGQSQRPETIIVPVSGIGDVTNTRKLILGNTLTDELKKHFRIVPQEKYEQVLEQVFEELEYEECSEDTCIMRVQEMLQVENVFNLQVLGEDKDTQLNLTWRTLDEKKNETDVCLGCGTFQLNDKVRGLVEKLVGEKRVGVVVQKKPIVVVEKKEMKVINFSNGEYIGEVKYGKRTGQGTMTYSDGGKYEGNWKDGKQHGQGTFTYTDGRKWAGEFRGNKPWNLSLFDKKGNIKMKWVNGKKQ